MKQLNKEVREFLVNTKLWTLSTNGEKGPNGIPTFFHSVTEDGKLVVANVFMKITPQNLQRDNRICISMADVTDKGPQGYLIKGKADFYKEGPYAQLAEKLTAPLREQGVEPEGGAIVLCPEEVVNSTPGPNNGKTL